MSEQLTIDGELVAYPPPRPRQLATRQRDLLRWLRLLSTVWADGVPTRMVGQFYADPSGALRRLEALGLVRRVSRGKWAAT